MTRYKRGDNVNVDSLYRNPGWSYGTVLLRYWKERYLVCSYDGIFRCVESKQLTDRKKRPIYLAGHSDCGFSLRDHLRLNKFWKIR